MEIGLQFFPDVGPAEKPADVYFAEALELVGLCDVLGYSHVRIVEHYFHPYGGYSPNPIVFLAAAAQRTKKARLVTGAVLPVFNNPLKLAGEIAMLDAISGGRLDVGFARAFLPHEFRRFGVPLDESKARFDEGIEQVRLLLSWENVAHAGKFHRFPATTSLPRPTQKPHPPFWIAALGTPESFINAGRNGFSIMAIPFAGEKMAGLLGLYRAAWKEAGHIGNGRVMLAFHMYCAESRSEAEGVARAPLERYLKSLVDAASDWTAGASSADYPGYDQIIAGLAKETYESQIAKGAALIGTPDDILAQIKAYDAGVGGFEVASLQVNFNTISLTDARRSTELFGREVLPRLR